MANTNLQFKTNYVVSSKIEPFYKGGKVQISKDEKYVFCTCGSRVNVLEISTGKIIHSVEHAYVTSRPLRSSNERRLALPPVRSRQSKLFSSVVPRWWNSLPVPTRSGASLSTFKKLLKTQIFREHLLS